jgi:hypothetical protein
VKRGEILTAFAQKIADSIPGNKTKAYGRSGSLGFPLGTNAIDSNKPCASVKSDPHRFFITSTPDGWNGSGGQLFSCRRAMGFLINGKVGGVVSHGKI